MFKLKSIAAVVFVSLLGSAALAQDWTLDGASSHIAFGSVKKNTVGEVHTFETLSGTVTADGAATIEIDLASVETLIDIRNERMVEYVFQNTPTATITAQIDMGVVSALAVGDSTVLDASGSLSLVGNALDINTELFVLRVSESRVMVTTQGMIMLSTVDLGLTAGIDKLMELANLPGITRVSPVTLRLIFDAGSDQAAAPADNTSGATEVALAGDVEAGKKIFRKCKACHSLSEGKNGAGPSLHAIMGAPAGQVDGFRYSKAMSESGIVWTAETLAGYLTDPKGYVPGNRMAFRGLRKEAEIENVIAYIASGG